MSTQLRHDQSDFNVIFVHSALDDAGLSVHAFRLYCHLARRAGRDGFINSGGKSMAAVCRMKRDTVFRVMRELEERGMLVRQKRGGETNSYSLTRASEWRTNPPIPNEEMSPETGLQPSPETGHKGNPSKVIQKGNPLAAAPPSRVRDLAFEMLVEIQGSKLDGLTKPERGRINAALKAMSEAMPPNTTREELAREIELRAGKYRKEWPNAALTASALVKHWSKFAAAKPLSAELPRLPEPAWDWVYVVNRSKLKISLELPWASLKPETQHRIVEYHQSLPPLGFEFWMDVEFEGWEQWENYPTWHTMECNYRDDALAFLSNWEPDGWRGVWSDVYSGQCASAWNELNDWMKYNLLLKLRARIKK